MKRGKRTGCGDLENHTRPVGTKSIDGTVEIAVTGLNQRGRGRRSVRWRSSNRIKRGERARRRDLENRAIAFISAAQHTASIGGAIQVAVAGLDQGSEGPRSICSRKGMKRGERTGERDLKDRAIARTAAGYSSIFRGAVKIAVSGLEQTIRDFAIAATCKCIESRQRAGRSALKDRAGAKRI